MNECAWKKGSLSSTTIPLQLEAVIKHGIRAAFEEDYHHRSSVKGNEAEFMSSEMFNDHVIALQFSNLGIASVQLCILSTTKYV